MLHGRRELYSSLNTAEAEILNYRHMKVYSLDETKNDLIGKPGTKGREEYESTRWWTLAFDGPQWELEEPETLYLLKEVGPETDGAFTAPDKSSALDYCDVVLGVDTNEIKCI